MPGPRWACVQLDMSLVLTQPSSQRKAARPLHFNKFHVLETTIQAAAPDTNTRCNAHTFGTYMYGTKGSTAEDHESRLLIHTSGLKPVACMASHAWRRIPAARSAGRGGRVWLQLPRRQGVEGERDGVRGELCLQRRDVVVVVLIDLVHAELRDA